MGLAPGLLPGRSALTDAGGALRAAWPLLPAQRGLDAAGILDAAAAGRIGCLVLLGSDPLADFPDRDLARRALAGAGRVIALDAFLTESSRQADVVLAVAAFGEKSGTTTNLEGRVSPLTQKVTAVGTSMEDWMVAVELAEQTRLRPRPRVGGRHRRRDRRRLGHPRGARWRRRPTVWSSPGPVRCSR